MKEPYWWYVLMVKQGKEREVISELNAVFKSINIDCEYEVFILESEQYYHKGKIIPGKKYLKRPVFPNHVFISTTLPQENFVGLFREYINNSAKIVKLLKYPNTTRLMSSHNFAFKSRYALNDEERIAMELRFPDHHCLGRSIGKIESNKLYVTLGPLAGKVGLILNKSDENNPESYDFVVRKIDRHHRMAVIETVMFNRIMTMPIALEIIEKNP